jgi:hypothetical protein
MGLSAAEYQIVLDLTAVSRPVAQQSGIPAAQAYAQREARPRCAAYLASQSAAPTPSGAGWPR